MLGSRGDRGTERPEDAGTLGRGDWQGRHLGHLTGGTLCKGLGPAEQEGKQLAWEVRSASCGGESHLCLNEEERLRSKHPWPGGHGVQNPLFSPWRVGVGEEEPRSLTRSGEGPSHSPWPVKTWIPAKLPASLLYFFCLMTLLQTHLVAFFPKVNILYPILEFSEAKNEAQNSCFFAHLAQTGLGGLSQY